MSFTRRTIAASVAALLGLGLAACTTTSGQDAGDSTPATSAPAPSRSSEPSASSTEDDDRDGTAIRITIGDQSLDATVWDPPTGRDLLSRLPLTMSFEDLSNAEKIGHLEQPLTMDGMPDGADPQIGDLGWYAPLGQRRPLLRRRRLLERDRPHRTHPRRPVRDQRPDQ
ncbi:MAG: hypothetical protein JST33_05050 [Actinobacteria bacterium]|nr:hypothetical protein [Actinomycetota bacterium]